MWSEIHEVRLAQTVKFGPNVVSVPARYVQVMTFVEAAGMEYQEKLVGVNLLAGGTARMFELMAMNNLAISPIEWESMSLNRRGELVAFLRLQNKVKLIERHEEIQRDQQRERRRRAKDKKGATSPE